MDLSEGAAQAEEQREQHFRHNEEERDRLFLENEERRLQETAARRDEILRDIEHHRDVIFSDLERRLAAIPPPRSPTMPGSPRPPSMIPSRPSSVEPSFESDARPVPPPEERPITEVVPPTTSGRPSSEYQSSMQETILSAAREASAQYAADLMDTINRERAQLAAEREEHAAELLEAVRLERVELAAERDAHARDILETVQREREELAAEREAAAVERERMHADAEDERLRMAEERDARVRELEEEVARLRAELESERAQRITDEAEARERERVEFAERDESMRAQLGDITNLVQDNREELVRKREMMEEHYNEKLGRRGEKDERWSEMREMVASLMEAREEDRRRAEEERIAAESRPRKYSHPRSPATMAYHLSGVEHVLEELEKQNHAQREMLVAMAES